VTINTYDATGNLLTTTTPSPGGKTAGSKTSFAYDSKGELTQVTDPLGHITKLTYTPAGLVSAITDPLNNVTSYQYDARGNRTAITDALNHQAAFQYDFRNRLTKVTKPDQSTVSFAYDARGRRISVTDENSKTTQYTYDDADRLISVTDANGAVTQYAYDNEGNLTGITDPRLHATAFSYDFQRRLTQTTFPSTKTETYAYDLVSNLTSKADRKGQVINYSYDELGRLTKKQYPDATSVAYTYDAASRLTQVQDPTGTYGLTYDNLGRLTQASAVYSFLAGKTFAVSYSYDAGSNRTSLTDPNGSRTRYIFDALDRLVSLKDFKRNSFIFSYDALSRTTRLARPNAVSSTYQYDVVSNLLSVLHQNGAATLDGVVYSYDPAGNRTSKTNKLNNITSKFAYDNLYQLSGVTQGTSTVESYTYDAMGNRLSAAGGSAYSYNASNELLGAGPASFTYDDNGNTLTRTDSSGTTAYAWDFENRLKSVTLPGGTSVTLRYDPMGRRIQKGNSIFVYDGANLIQESDPAGNLVARYIQGPGIDQPLAVYRGTTAEFYEADALGSITSLTNTSGAVNQGYVFDSFGNTSLITGTSVQPFRYAGREFDSETGLYYYRARYYSPDVGRFINEDPLGFNAGVNFYAYVGNSPLSFYDPFGLARYVLIVGQPGLGEHNIGQTFELAAQTEAADLRAQGNDVTIYNAGTVQDLNAALNAELIDGGVEYFGHSTYNSLYIGEGAGADTNLTFGNVNLLSNAHLGSNAVITLQGCFAGSGGDDSIAQAIANQLKRQVKAYPQSTFFARGKCPKYTRPGDRAPSKVPARVCQQGGDGPLSFYPKK
jgi:RHS repeat-associated protein